jgi:hypothetical protein
MQQTIHGRPMSIPDAQDQFLTFIDYNHLLSEQTGSNYYNFAYRLDTWQIWPICKGEHPEPNEEGYPCANPGIHATIDSVDDGDGEPFVAMLGPFELMRGDDIEWLYRTMTKSIASIMQFSMIHIHLLGYPCHEECGCNLASIEA